MGNKNVSSIIKTPAMCRGIQNVNAERFGILVFNTVSLIYLILISLELIAGCRHPPWNSVIETKIDFDQIHNQLFQTQTLSCIALTKPVDLHEILQHRLTG